MSVESQPEAEVTIGDFLLDLTEMAKSPKVKKRDAKILAQVVARFWKRFETSFSQVDRVLLETLIAVLYVKTR